MYIFSHNYLNKSLIKRDTFFLFKKLECECSLGFELLKRGIEMLIKNVNVTFPFYVFDEMVD